MPEAGACFNIKTIFPSIGIPMLRVRQLWNRLIFSMGIPILVKRHLKSTFSHARSGRGQRWAENWLQHKSLHAFTHTRSRSGSKIRSATNGSNTQFSASASKPRAPNHLCPQEMADPPTSATRMCEHTCGSGAGMSKSACLRCATAPHMCECSCILRWPPGYLGPGYTPHWILWDILSYPLFDSTDRKMYPHAALQYHVHWVNPLASGIFEWNFREVLFKLISTIDVWGIACEIAIRRISLDLADNKSTLVQIMTWCRQATSHYLSQCWPRSLSPYGITRLHWVKGQAWHCAVKCE